VKQDAVLRVIFLNCPRRKELESILGSQLFLRLELDQAAFAPVNIELNTQEGELVSQYERLFGNAEIRVDRESVTVSQANALLGDPDESVRQAAWEGLNTFVLAQAPQFHA
jgi:oligoendopeptidase F